MINVNNKTGGNLMKRLVCVLSLAVILFVGSVAVYSNPHPLPDTDNGCLVNSFMVTTDTFFADSDS